MMDRLTYLLSKVPDGKLLGNGWFQMYCLNPTHKETKPSFGVHLEHGNGYCFGCQIKLHWLQVVAALEGVGEIEAAVIAHGIQGAGIETGQPTYRAPAKKRDTRYHPYWQSRGIKYSTALRFELGYDEATDCVYLPAHFPDGTLAGYVRRSVTGKLYLNDAGMPKGEILLGYHLFDYPLPRLLCSEGASDYLILNQEVGPTVGRLGWDLSATQLRLLRSTGSNPTIVVDNDHTGLIQADKWTDEGFDIAFTQLPYKDPGDMMKEVGYVQLTIFTAIAWQMRRRFPS